MKKVILLLWFSIPLLLFSQINSELIKPDQRLIEVYGQQYIGKVMVDNPFLIQRWNFYLDHAFFVTDEVPEKGNTYPIITIDDLESINILKLEKEQQIHKDWNQPTIYRIKDTGKLLIYHSGKDFASALKKHLGQG